MLQELLVQLSHLCPLLVALAAGSAPAFFGAAGSNLMAALAEFIKTAVTFSDVVSFLPQAGIANGLFTMSAGLEVGVVACRAATVQALILASITRLCRAVLGAELFKATITQSDGISF